MKRSVHSEIRINCSAQKIIEALIEEAHLKNWWAIDSAFIQPKDGGLYTLTWLRSMDGIKFIQTGKIKLLNKRSHLHLEDVLYINSEKPIIGPFTINFDIESKSNYSILKVVQNGFGKEKKWDWYYNAVIDGWPEALVFLKKYLEKV